MSDQKTSKVLLVDDVEDNRLILERRLSRRGYKIISVSSGYEAIEWLAQNSADIILLDWMMSGMSGLDVLKQIRTNPASSDVPVLMVTARTAGEDISEALAAGASDYVTKPVDIAILTARMTVHLERAAAIAHLNKSNYTLEKQVKERTSQLSEMNDQLREALKQAMESSRAKSSFLANMSHELRTPLNSIIGFADLLTNYPKFNADPDKVVDYCQHIHRSGTHLLEIVNDILDFAKVEEQKMVVRPLYSNLHELIEDAIAVCQGEATRQDVFLRLVTKAANIDVFVDPLLIKRALINIISNAVKFSDPGMYVWIGYRQEHDEAIVEVADEGIGMTAGDLSVALEPFKQIDSTMGKRFQGTGLGLPLANALATLNNGSLILDSRSQVGTRATFRLPLHPSKNHVDSLPERI